MAADDICLTPAELVRITGGYTRAADQLRVLHERGFFRAAIIRGNLILERSHYDAVARSQVGGEQPARRPRLKSQRTKESA